MVSMSICRKINWHQKPPDQCKSARLFIHPYLGDPTIAPVSLEESASACLVLQCCSHLFFLCSFRLKLADVSGLGLSTGSTRPPVKMMITLLPSPFSICCPMAIIPNNACRRIIDSMDFITMRCLDCWAYRKRLSYKHSSIHGTLFINTLTGKTGITMTYQTKRF